MKNTKNRLFTQKLFTFSYFVSFFNRHASGARGQSDFCCLKFSNFFPKKAPKSLEKSKTCLKTQVILIFGAFDTENCCLQFFSRKTFFFLPPPPYKRHDLMPMHVCSPPFESRKRFFYKYITLYSSI